MTSNADMVENVALVIGYKRVEKSISSTLLLNSDVTMKLSDSLCDKGLISSEKGKLEKSSPKEKADSLIHAVNETLVRSPGNLPGIIEEMEKYNCLLEWVVRAKEHEKFEKAVDKVEKDIKGKLGALEKEMREERAAIDKQMEEVMKKAYEDNPVPTGLMKPQRFPDVTTSTTEELIEWMRIEFEHLEKETIRVQEERKEGDLKRLKEGLDKIMEETTRKEEQFDREIAENIQRAKATAQEFKEQMSAINKSENEKLKKGFEELLESQKKFNEETLDRYLERERRIDAVVEAIDSGTYEIKEVEQSYKSGLVPEWTHPSLSKVSYTVTPVYRTIQGFQEKIITKPFYTTCGGYKMTLEVCPNGFYPYVGDHVSIVVYLMKGESDNLLLFPFTGNIIVEALRWDKDDGHVKSIISFDESVPLECRQRVTVGDKAVRGRGSGDFIPHHDLQQYLLNDMMCLRVSFADMHFRGSRVPSWYSTDINSHIPPCTFTMRQFSQLKKSNSVWPSKPFYTSERGYKLYLEVDANGWGPYEGTHLSIFVIIMKGEYDDQLQWPFNATITVQILNWLHDSDHLEETIHHYKAPLEYRIRVFGDTPAGGWGAVFTNSEINIDNGNIKYINDDKLCFRITEAITLDGDKLQ